MITSFILTGAIFGFTAGISPGPLLTLVIAESIRHNRKEGIKVALAPLVTDLPIIALAFFILSRLSQFSILLGVISLSGGLFIAWLGYECLRSKGLAVDMQHFKPASLKKGIIANILNPHPYLFWVTVGIPIVIKAYETNVGAVLLFFLSFYVFLLGSKIGVAILADKTRALLNSRIYIWIMRILGMALFVFAILFIVEGIKTLTL